MRLSETKADEGIHPFFAVGEIELVARELRSEPQDQVFPSRETRVVISVVQFAVSFFIWL